MVKQKGECKICGHTVEVGDSTMPPGIAAEGVMEGIQEHIFREHCNDDLELVDGSEEYSGVGDAWEYA